VDPHELQGLTRQCPNCSATNNAIFKYYNNTKTKGKTQPRFHCLSCERQFSMRFEGGMLTPGKTKGGKHKAPQMVQPCMTPLAFVANDYHNVEDLEHGGDGGSSSLCDEYGMLSEEQEDQSNTMVPVAFAANECHNLEDLEYGGDGGSSSFCAYEYNMLTEEQGDQSSTDAVPMEQSDMGQYEYNMLSEEQGDQSSTDVVPMEQSDMGQYEYNMLSEEQGDQSSTDAVPMEQSDMGQCSYSYTQEMAMSTMDDSAMLYLDDSEEDLDFLTQLSMIYEIDHHPGEDDALALWDCIEV
jgi:hypothetical protein